MSRPLLRCSILAIGDYPEGGASSQRLGMLARIFQQGIGETSIWIMHPSSRVPIRENNNVSAEKDGIRYTYLSGRTVRPEGLFGTFMDTVRWCLRVYGAWLAEMTGSRIYWFCTRPNS